MCIRLKLAMLFVWKNGSCSIKFNLIACLMILMLQRVTGFFSCIFSKLLSTIKFRYTESNNLNPSNAIMLYEVDEIINLRTNNSTVNGIRETSNIFYDIEPFKLPFFFMLTFSLILFLDGKFIHNGFLSNLRNNLWLRIRQHLKYNISKRLFFNIEK